MMATSSFVIFALLAIGVYASQDHDVETHKDFKPHKGFKAYYHEKKIKDVHHHKPYGHDDKHFHKGLKAPTKHALEVPDHEAHLQGDLKSAKGYKNRQNHDNWHKKDMHLQDLSFNGHKSHHATHNPRPKIQNKEHGHHMLQNDQPAVASHHKGSSSEEHGYLHRPHKVTPSSPSIHGDKGHHHQKPAKVMTRTFHPEHEIKPEPIHAKKNTHHKDKGEHPSWSKNKKQKKAYEKKIKQKQHRKKQFKGELHKLW